MTSSASRAGRSPSTGTRSRPSRRRISGRTTTGSSDGERVMYDLPDYATSIFLDEPFRRAAPTGDPGGVVEEVLRVLREEAPDVAVELERVGVTGRSLVRALLTV